MSGTQAMYADSGDYTYPPGMARTGAGPDCRTADQKIAGHLADLQTAIRLLVGEVAALRGELQQLRCQPEADGRSVVQGFAELRREFGPFFDAIPNVDDWVRAVRSGDDPPAAAAGQGGADGDAGA